MVYASPEQIREVKTEINQLTRMLKGKQIERGVFGRADKIQDKDAILQEIRQKEKFLETYEPKKLRGEAANKAYARAKELEEKISECLQGSKDYFQKYADKGKDGLAFDRAVDHEMRLMKDKKYKQMVKEFRAIMRQLDPDNPTLGNLERFRR